MSSHIGVLPTPVTGKLNPEQYSAAAQNKKELGKEDFLNLLVAQLMHQDPLKPDGDTEFISQLAQFSSLEQLIGIGQGMEGLAMAQMSTQSSDIVGFIGKDVVASSDTIQLPEEGGATIGWGLPYGADSVSVEIRNHLGAVVRTVEIQQPQRQGNTTWHWDGTDDDGHLLPMGEYTFSVKATQGTGEALSEPLVRMRVTGVTFESGYPELRLGAAQKVTLADVREVLE
jgi:flagellar basal-body rod modification protein FlgD